MLGYVGEMLQKCSCAQEKTQRIKIAAKSFIMKQPAGGLLLRVIFITQILTNCQNVILLPS